MGGMTDSDDRADPERSPEEQAALDRDALMRKLRGWHRTDRDASSKWREDAKEDYDFVAGRQWSAQDEAALREQGRRRSRSIACSRSSRPSRAPK